MAPELQEFLMLLLQAMLAIAVPVLTIVVREWVLTKIAEGRARLTKEQLAILDTIVATFVMSAEQAGLIGLIEKEGAAKKEWVIQRVQEELDRLGLPKVSVQVISDLIEAKVQEGLALPLVK